MEINTRDCSQSIAHWKILQSEDQCSINLIIQFIIPKGLAKEDITTDPRAFDNILMPVHIADIEEQCLPIDPMSGTASSPYVTSENGTLPKEVPRTSILFFDGELSSKFTFSFQSIP